MRDKGLDLRDKHKMLSQEVQALKTAQEGAEVADADVALIRARVSELEGEVRQLRPAGIRARELEDRVADRDQRLEKLRAEVRS